MTAEPFLLAPEVHGRELASVRRRAAALLLDSLVWFVLATPLLIGFTLAALHLRAPSLADYVRSVFAGQMEEDGNRAVAELLLLVHRQKPSALPARFADAAAAGNLDRLEALLEEDEVDIQADLGSDTPSYYDAPNDRLYVRRDLIFGPLSSIFSYAAIAIVYFTFGLRLGRGRTLGKLIFGVRVLRIDGRPLTLADSFSRAGGYAASLSTLGLGFAQSLWDPNRQALHDRVAGTVVVRQPRRSVRGRLRAFGSRLLRRSRAAR